MLRFKNCGTHIKDEEYMNKMSGKGFQTKSLVEGFWVFERGKKNKYVYRVYYFRGMNKKDISNKIKELEKQEIEFVHKYSFWGIFRSQKDFHLYSREEELEVCYKIRKPMLVAVILCPILIVLFFALGCLTSKIFFIVVTLLAIYYFICLYLMIEYTKLIKSLKTK